MRLSTKGRYAVMAMADLAAHEQGARPVSLADVAQRQEISLSYLEQLFAKLRRGGLVRSVRGPGGGYRLSRASNEIRVADIIVAVDEPMTATRCKAGSPKGCYRHLQPLRDARSVGRAWAADPGVPVVGVAGRRRREARARTHASLRAAGRGLMHYLDHNATSPLRPEAREAMARALKLGGNPSSVHAAGRGARRMVEAAREQVAALMGVKPEEVIFTSGGTEANALALRGAVEGAAEAGERITRLFVSAIEHDSVLATAAALAERTPRAASRNRSGDAGRRH